ncbi:hypothetical protein CEB3_c24130 [Peptococcaceae bacterium CEB3]|nr:hypothetical protein CEB3_c24130 [Peptococcaceae bacterium CEB3]
MPLKMVHLRRCGSGTRIEGSETGTRKEGSERKENGFGPAPDRGIIGGAGMLGGTGTSGGKPALTE